MTKFLIECGADVLAEDEYGSSVLSNACLYGSAILVKYLLKIENIKKIIGPQTLHDCAWGGNIEAMKLLLETGIKVDVHDPDNNCAMVYAARRGSLEMVSFSKALS